MVVDKMVVNKMSFDKMKIDDIADIKVLHLVL